MAHTVHKAAYSMSPVSRLSLIALVALPACSTKSERAYAPTVAESDSSPSPSSDTGARDAATTNDAASDSAPDFGPVEDVVTGGEGPGIDLGTPGPIAGCSKDELWLSANALTIAGPKAFADAYRAQTTQAILVDVRGLAGVSNAVRVKLGAPGGKSSFAADPAPIELAAPVSLGTRSLVAARTDTSFALVFGDVSIPVVAVGLKATLPATCDGLTSATLTLLIPASASEVPFAGSTLGALLGATNDAVDGNDAWRVQLVGALGGT
jgi:hypothetical protein